jgi:small redox-active disulfide protein 2
MNHQQINIQVLGSGCPSCKRLYESTKEAVAIMGIVADVEYVTDLQKIVEMGVMQSPVLAINGKPVIAGSVPNKELIIEILRQQLST